MIFWKFNITKRTSHEICLLKERTQKWKGAAPSFKINIQKHKIKIILFKNFLIKINRLLINNKEANLWIKKYFKETFEFFIKELTPIKPIKLRELSSIINHNINNEEEHKEIKIVKIK